MLIHIPDSFQRNTLSSYLVKGRPLLA